MARLALHSILRLMLAGLAVAVIADDLVGQADRGVLDPLKFFSVFTVQSNLIGAAALVAAAVTPYRHPVWVHALRGAATVYLALTFIGWAVLFAHPTDTELFSSSGIVHRLMPLGLAVDWLIDPPPGRVTLRLGLIWLAYPAAWLAWTMARGAVDGWYPYAFLDPTAVGWAGVLAYLGVFVVWLLAVIGLVAVSGNLRSGQAGWPRTPSVG